MYQSAVLLVFLKFASVSVASNLHFLQDVTSHYTFHSTALNILTCNDQETINLIKMLSPRFQRFVAVHSADKPLHPFPDEPQIFLLDLQCPKAMEILQQAEDLKLFCKPFQWLLLNDDVTNEGNSSVSETEESWIWPFMESLNVLIDSDVKVVEKRSDETITVTGGYKLGRNFIKEPLAEWTSKDRLVFLNIKSVALRRWNLQGLVLSSSIVVTHTETLLHLHDLVDKHIDTTTKASYNVVYLFADMFNASITYKMEKEWGIFVNGSWTGMVGDIQKKEVEFGASPVFMRQSRFSVLEYYAAVNPSRLNFIFLSPPMSYANNIFVMPFDNFVWGSCFAMVTISCFLLFLSLNYEKVNFLREDKTVKDDTDVSFSEILVLNIGAICLQGTYAQTKDPPSRIITLFLYLSYMFLYISYSAAIVAILQSSDTSIQTLVDFLRSPLKAGADDVGYSQYYFKAADDEVRKAIYNAKIAPKGEAPHFLPVEKGVEEIRKGFYSYHTEVTSGYFLIQKSFTEAEKCALQELKEYYIPFFEPWLVMRRKSPYAEHLKIGIKMSIEKGFKSRFSRRYYTEKPVCSSKSARFVSVGMVDCYYAFMPLAIGSAIAIFIFLLELSFKKYLKMRGLRRLSNNQDVIPHIDFFN